MIDEQRSPEPRPPDPADLDLVATATLLAAASRRLLALASGDALAAHQRHGRSPHCAAAEYASRRARDVAFEDLPGMFGEPAWDILLDLYDREADRKRTSVSSASIAARVPATTALRYIGSLERSGLVMREADATDRRRTFLRLTEDGLARMRAVFDG